MFRFCIYTIISLIFLTQNSISAEANYNEGGYNKFEVSQNYYTSNPYSEYTNQIGNKSFERYHNNQYRGNKIFKRTKVYQKPKYYVELGFRGSKIFPHKNSQQIVDDEDPDISETKFHTSEISYKTGIGGALRVGIDGIKHRLDFSFSYEKNKAKPWTFEDFNDIKFSEINTDNTTVSVFSFGINYYLDFFKRNIVSPYIGAGAGMSQVKLKRDFFNVTDKVFSYELTLGTRFRVSENRRINLSYRYRGSIGDLKYDSAFLDLNNDGEKQDSEPLVVTESKYSAQIAEISYQLLF